MRQLFTLVSLALGIGLAPLGASAQPIPADLISPNFIIDNSSPAFVDMLGRGVFDVVFVAADPAPPPPGALLPPPPPVCDSIIIGDPIGTGARGASEGGITRGTTLKVHVLDGAAVPPYSVELAGFPQSIGDGTPSCGREPTVAVDSNLDFVAHQQVVVVGGGAAQVFAFRPNGSTLPGWASVLTRFNFFNAAAVDDANNDGMWDPFVVDESTYPYRINALGVIRQEQVNGDPDYSSPAIGDTGRLGSRVADGIGDEITAAMPQLLDAFDSFGKSLTFGREDLLFSYAVGCLYASSPALADLDGDGTQDIVIHCGSTTNPRLQVFASRDGLQEFNLAAGNTPKIGIPGYASPAVIDLDGDGSYNEILISDDGGFARALRYDPTAPVLKLSQIWATQLDTGYAASASPIAVQLAGASLPTVVAASDAGNVHVLDAVTGAKTASYSLLAGRPYDDSAAIYSTPAIWTDRPTNPPWIVVGNRRGLFKMVRTGSPTPNPAITQWPTFHRNNARTGALPYTAIPTRGSVGGVALGTCAGRPVALLDGAGVQVDDYYGGPAQQNPLSDGRFGFELRSPGAYVVRFGSGGASPVDVPITVSAGVMTFVQRDGCN